MPYLVLAFSGIMLMIWWYLSPRPYDDDCVARYFIAQSSFADPKLILDLWARPIAILFFMVPAQFGYEIASFSLILLTIGSCWFTWQAAEKLNIPNAWLAIPLLAFQPVFFTTGWGLVSEPHAAFLLALGIWLYHSDKKIWAAIVLSFLPLGRTEMILVLPFFALLFIMKKEWKPILFLGVGLLLYNLSAWFLTGDIMDGLTKIRTYGTGLNYAKKPWDHYFLRFIYFTGPVLFCLMFLQVVMELRRFTVSVYTLIFFTVMGFHIYITTWGPPIVMGFLRHLVPLSPIIALMAVKGFGEWQNGMKDKTLKIVVLAALSLLIFALFSWEIKDDYVILSEGDESQPEYFKLGISLAILAVMAIQSTQSLASGMLKNAMIGIAVLGTFAYTMVKEKPLAFNMEQEKVYEFQKWYRKQPGITAETRQMAAHPFYLFKEDFSIYNPKNSGADARILRMRTEEMKHLPVGGYVIWDSHYSHRLSQNVQLEQINGNPAFRYVKDFKTKDNRFMVALFQKIAETPDSFPGPMPWRK